MAQFSSWFSRVFAADATRGLSGDVDRVVLDEGGGSFYSSRLRVYRTDADLIGEPINLWDTVAPDSRPGGLKAHLLAEIGEGVAGFTDVLIVLSEFDYIRSQDPFGDPWEPVVLALLREHIEQFCLQTGTRKLFPNRPFQFRIVRDGGEEIGERLGLREGQFITGLLPNLYVAPGPGSVPVISVHLNIPGEWEGYREVGTLYSDQLIFTLGNHGLDNYAHPALRQTALYRLQQQPDGSLVHMISPEHVEAFQVRTVQTPEGPSVLTIAEKTGHPVAYLVLAVVEGVQPETEAPLPVEVEPLPEEDSSDTRRRVVESDDVEEGDSTMAVFLQEGQAASRPVSDPVVRPAGQMDGGPGPVVSPPVGVRAAPAAAPAARPEPARFSMAGGGPRSAGQQSVGFNATIIPDAMDERVFTLKERGALLQKVHFSTFMEGYDVYVGQGGQLGTAIDDPVATFQVRRDRVFFISHSSDVRLGNRPVALDTPLALRGEVEIRVGNQLLEYRDLSGVKADGWPYLAEIRRSQSSSYMVFGGVYGVGRDRKSKVRLPDEPHNDNIVWRRDLRDSDTIRSRTGRIPKSRFYNDSIMVASEHAEIDLETEPRLKNVARHCYTFVRRGLDVVALLPISKEGGVRDLDLLPGDEILIGNNLFEVSYPPTGSVSEAPLTAEELALVADSATRPEELPPLAFSNQPEVDPPVAAGMGERGAPPPRIRLPTEGFDSILEYDVPQPRALVEEPPPAARTDRAPPPRTPAASPPRRQQALVDAPSLPDTGLVVLVDEAAWQLELSRPARFVLVGWTISGEVVVGNHRQTGVVLPENRILPEQRFMPCDYFRVQSRGRRGKVVLLSPNDARLSVNGDAVRETGSLEEASMEVVRCDEVGDEDFTIPLSLRREEWLPDPRARLLAIGMEDRMVAALFTLGLPLRIPRQVELGPIACEAVFDGSQVRLSNYLSSYRGADGGFVPFLVKKGDLPFKTAPEDGAPITLYPDDLILAGIAIYRFQVI